LRSRQRLRFKTRKEAERFLTDTAHKASRGEFVDPAKIPKFVEVAEDWLRSQLDRRPSYVSDLRARLDKHLKPHFGPRRLNTIGVTEFEKLRDDLRDKGYAPITTNQILRIASSVFLLAIKRGQCAANPLDRVERARRVAREIISGEPSLREDELSPDNILDPDEVRRLLDAAQPGLERTLFLSAFVTGAREGELLALRWSDLDLPNEGPGKIAIRRSLSWARLKGDETRHRYFPPKTKSGRRVIQIPREVIAAPSALEASVSKV